jgi:uncharacterized protein (DUF2235 family)
MALYAFDGTWNKEKDTGCYGLNTNVARFRELYTGTTFFYRGPGTKHGPFAKLVGGAFSVGGQARIQEARRNLARQFAAGDRDIDIVGFSRGAALALHFASVIARSGIAVNGRVEKPAIRFLGVWEVVAAFGVPINLGFDFKRLNLGYRLGLPKQVQHCYHAIALDEWRPAFRPTRVRSACEVWFRGLHSDVGGGNDNRALNDLSLRWMLRKALAGGLPMSEDCVTRSCDRANVNGHVAEYIDLINGRAREPEPEDRFHYSVSERPRHVNPPRPCTRESELHEVRTWSGA